MLKLQSHSILLVTSLALAACQAKGPTPAEPASPATTERPPAATAEAAAKPAGQAAGADAANLQFTPPANWESQAVSSSMRKAQYRVPGKAGDAELVVYYFGPQGAGSADANIDRWVSQFQNPDGSPIADAQPSRRQVNGLDVTTIEVTGRYVAAMQGTPDERHGKTGQRMLAAIIEAGEGPYYLKMIGPDATVSENRGGFEQLLTSLEPGR
jgi:hypothetical protein